MNSDPTTDAPGVASHALLGRESRTLVDFRAKWVGLRVMHDGQPATVVVVCDDGHACDGDERRRFKPTGELIIRMDSATTDDYCLPRAVTILPNDKSSNPDRKQP